MPPGARPFSARSAPPLGARRAKKLVGLVAALLLVAGCGGDDDDPPASASTVPNGTSSTTESTTSTTAALTPEQEVEQAYLHSWDVYAEAVRELDPSGLADAYAESSLETLRSEVQRLKEANTPVVVDVEHNYDVQVVGPAEAVVVDQYLNKSHRIDGSTGEPIDETDPVQRHETYQMKRFESSWKVVFISQQA